MFKCLLKKYNKCHEAPLPKVIPPYTMRYIFCTKKANAGMNPKALHYIMGHEMWIRDRCMILPRASATLAR